MAKWFNKNSLHAVISLLLILSAIFLCGLKGLLLKPYVMTRRGTGRSLTAIENSAHITFSVTSTVVSWYLDSRANLQPKDTPVFLILSFIGILVACWCSLNVYVAGFSDAQIWSLGWEDPLEKEMATHSSVLAWRIPWTEELGRLPSMGSQRVGHDWVTNTML